MQDTQDYSRQALAGTGIFGSAGVCVSRTSQFIERTRAGIVTRLEAAGASVTETAKRQEPAEDAEDRVRPERRQITGPVRDRRRPAR
jgi:hypothetical protein